MKVIIEDSDVQEFQHVCEQYLGLIPPTDQTREIIADSVEIQRELLYDGGLTDTSSREVVADVVIEQLLINKNIEVPVRDKYFDESDWHWPMFGSSKEYTQAFYEKIEASAKESGWTIVPESKDEAQSGM